MAIKSKLTVHEHLAEKAGRHYDLRLLMPNGSVQSFALPKATIPSEKNKILAIKTHTYDESLLNFNGVIDDGYGKGIIKILEKLNIVFHEVSDDKISFEVSKDNKVMPKGIYYLIRTKNDQYIFLKKKGS